MHAKRPFAQCSVEGFMTGRAAGEKRSGIEIETSSALAVVAFAGGLIAGVSVRLEHDASWIRSHESGSETRVFEVGGMALGFRFGGHGFACHGLGKFFCRDDEAAVGAEGAAVTFARLALFAGAEW